jgi:hypothetical protein
LSPALSHALSAVEGIVEEVIEGKGRDPLRNSVVMDEASNGKDEIADKVEGDSPGKAKRLVAPGMEDALGGQTLGQYRLMARLGRGGMATVYKAYQPSLDRYVAVKVLSTFLAQDPDFTDRFEQEAKAIAKLNHPNILPVHDYGQEGELIYIVMRYVEGGTLQDMMLGQPMDLDTAVEITAQMGGALDYAHQRGIVHRDVKPSNVLMADGNWALLSDFGLARIIGASTRITKAGVGMGTPDYIAPEQARGASVDGRSDIYSLAIVLFEMLTGRVPFEGDTSLVVLYKHVTDPPPPPREINPDIPEAVERVVLKALAKDPVDRFQRVGEMVTALQKAVAGGPVVTAAVSLEADRERQERRLAGLYAQAVTLLEAEEWQKALEKWAKVQAIDPTHPDPQEVASRAKRGLAGLEAAVTPAEGVPSMKGEAVPIWRKLPVWVWAAIGGAILSAAVIAGAALPASPTADSELPVAVSPTSTPVPATPTVAPTAVVAATQTAMAAEVMATAVAQVLATVDASMPTPTSTPTQTPAPRATTAPHTLTSAAPTPVPTAIPAPTSSIALTIYLRDTNTETGDAALSSDRRYGWMIYKEGQFVYGDAAVQIGDTVYHFDEPGELGQLPDPWRVEFEFAEELVARTEGEPGFDAKKARFWVGTLGDASAVAADRPYSLTMKLYEGRELRESLQVFFTVSEQTGDVGVVVDTGGEEGGLPGGGPPGGGPPGGGPPNVPPGQDKDKDKKPKD